ncbi:TetR/AcrR family transcriptional regulator [Deinococcus sedimenti]|uniref:TetR family transcriptional regulator n=1 Tax=Deinococcus sedimenti TaxID=1867090 RepID=A0ABQ2S643_9DEIO|nr:TetR/AcrR family transcriptional regulator [Deinococcus sedimenti]GGS01151.1 TetR family transcriptional regulator [Deinococcus sedimenti]
MARPRQISDEVIIAAAQDVFLEQGFSATTAAIARRAGVSEGTLFNRFASKEDLFVAAIGLHVQARWQAELLGAAGQGDVRRNLERALLSMLREAEQLVPKLMVMFSRGHDTSHNPILMRLGDPMQLAARNIATYLEAEVHLGRLRPLDAEVAALTVVGSLSHFVHREQMMPGQGSGLEAGRFVRGLMDLLWPGMAP